VFQITIYERRLLSCPTVIFFHSSISTRDSGADEDSGASEEMLCLFTTHLGVCLEKPRAAASKSKTVFQKAIMERERYAIPYVFFAVGNVSSWFEQRANFPRHEWPERRARRDTGGGKASLETSLRKIITKRRNIFPYIFYIIAFS
jgi:hypothetical protein